MLFVKFAASQTAQSVRLAERSNKVFPQGSVLMRAIRIDLVLRMSSFLNVILEQTSSPRQCVRAEESRVALPLTLPKWGCVLDVSGHAVLHEGSRYNLVKYVVKNYRHSPRSTTSAHVNLDDFLPAVNGVASPSYR